MFARASRLLAYLHLTTSAVVALSVSPSSSILRCQLDKSPLLLGTSTSSQSTCAAFTRQQQHHTSSHHRHAPRLPPSPLHTARSFSTAQQQVLAQSEHSRSLPMMNAETVLRSRPEGTRRLADNLEKPLLDNRSYRVIELPNKLEALLIHDPDTDKASAAMDVNVGSLSDPEDMQGMAHAVEHLLFMGTEKVSMSQRKRGRLR